MTKRQRNDVGSFIPEELEDLDELEELEELDESEFAPLWGLPLRGHHFDNGAPVSTVDCFELMADAGEVARILNAHEALWELGPRDAVLRLYFLKRVPRDGNVYPGDLIGILTLRDGELRLETNEEVHTVALRGVLEEALGTRVRWVRRERVNPFEVW